LLVHITRLKCTYLSNHDVNCDIHCKCLRAYLTNWQNEKCPSRCNNYTKWNFFIHTMFLFRCKPTVNINSIFSDGSTGSCICLRRHIYMSHVLLLCISFLRVSVLLLTCDMYMCRLRHIHDPVLPSLNMEGIRLLYSLAYSAFCCF
jgi:hypothetical protein